VIGVVIVFLIVASFSSYRSLNQARRLLNQAHVTITASIGNESDLESPSGRATAQRGIAQVSADATEAEQELHSSFGLSVLGVLPLLHTQRQGLLQLVDNLRASATTGGVLLRQVDALANASAGTNISLPQLRELQVTVAAAHRQFASYDRPSAGLWGPLGTAQREFDREDVKITQLLADGNRVMSYALPFLGGDGPRSYLVMGENNAEMRDEGSTLSYSLLHTNGGVINETPGGSVGNIQPPSPVPDITVPAGTEEDFGELDPTGIWQSTNATADFSFSGLDMDRMFANTTGIHVNGVIGIDVVALQALLGLTGPVSVAGIPEAITTQNATYVLLDQLYEGLPPDVSQTPRHEELSAVASAVFHQLQVKKVDVFALARTLATEVAERHLQLWDANPEYERTISAMGASGDIDTDDPTRTFHVAVENATATKLDYFVDVAISDTVTIASDGSATVDTAVTLTNHAPAAQPPSYQLGPDDINSFVSGEYVGRVFLWGPRGSEQKGSVNESGLLLANEVDLPVMPGKSVTAHFATTIPNAIQHNQLRLVFVPQPRLAPESLVVHVLASGTQDMVRAALTKTTTLTWEFQRT
jgi:hypothetical protein